MMNPGLAELCRRAKITDYLAGRGVELRGSGTRLRCRCPIPGHEDTDPSFYVRTLEDGIQVFRCFGKCNLGGTIITLVHLIEGKRKGAVVRELSSATGVDVGNFAPADRTEPAPDEITQFFCEEDVVGRKLGTYGVEFMQAWHGSDDAVNKASRLYEAFDEEIARGGSGIGMLRAATMMIWGYRHGRGGKDDALPEKRRRHAN